MTNAGSSQSPKPNSQPDAPVTAVLVDDHTVILDCLQPLLERSVKGFKVVGTASDGTKAVDVVRNLRPSIVVMDIDLPGMGSFDAARQMLAESPNLRILFLSGHQHDEYIEQALRVGASGYVVKHDRMDAVIEAVKTIIAGNVYYSPSIVERLTVRPDGNMTLDRPVSTRLSQLSERERQVLIMLARGESVKRVAAALKLAYKTVDKHKVSLMKKLDIHDRVELCRFAVRERLIEA
jgi:DNA-binding NarL/FixJ family response regulator